MFCTHFRTSSRRIALAVAGSLIAACSLVSHAQPYPTRPIRMIVPFPPGGGLDAMGRLMAQWLSQAWEQQVIVDNRPGAGGTIGAAIGAKAAPDGYTLIAVSSSHTINATLYRELSYDALKDFAPVLLVTSVPHLLVVHPSFPATTVKELIALASAKPGQIAYASGGAGSSTHLAGELFKHMANVDLLHVAYKGTGPSLVDVVRGRVPVTFGTVPAVMSNVKAGKLRPLGLTGSKRSLSAPEVPTIAEAGVTGYEAATWHGLLVPAGVPKAIITKLHTEISAMLVDPQTRANIVRMGIEPVGSTPAEFDAHLRDEVAKWAKVIHRAGIPLQ